MACGSSTAKARAKWEEQRATLNEDIHQLTAAREVADNCLEAAQKKLKSKVCTHGGDHNACYLPLIEIAMYSSQ